MRLKSLLSEETKTVTIIDLVNELISPRGTYVAESEVEADSIAITVEHDFPEHAFKVNEIKKQFGSVISKFSVEKGDGGPSTARRYIATPKMNLTPTEIKQINAILAKAQYPE